MMMMAMMINDSNPIRQRFDRGGWKKERGGESIKYYLLPHGREKLYQLSTGKNKKEYSFNSSSKIGNKKTERTNF